MSIFLDNDWEYEINITQKNTTTGAPEAAPDLTGLTGRISTTPTGATIDADLEKVLAERSNMPGEYFAIVDGDDLRAHLTAGATVYEIIGDGTSILISQVRTVQAVRNP